MNIRLRISTVFLLFFFCTNAYTNEVLNTNSELNHLNLKREFKITKHYLNLPIKNGGTKLKLLAYVDGVKLSENSIELNSGNPDWWAPMDVSAYLGKTITLEVDNISDQFDAFRYIEESDTIKNSDKLYHEPLRPQLHFSPKRGWTNDPNGLVFYKGLYHLFFQHNPFGVKWGNMHWGHATSKDLVHWHEEGDVLSPDDLGSMYSGSAVVDWNNTSGFGTFSNPPLVLIYTAANNTPTQCLAYSYDGHNFTKYTGNPVLKTITNQNRDPKVMWNEASKQWIMVLYAGFPIQLNQSKTDNNYVYQYAVKFLTSKNLRDWKSASTSLGGSGNNHFLYECPDLFELPLDDNHNETHWVITAANSSYAIGLFDGSRFNQQSEQLTGNEGKGFYAAQTFSDIPDGRRIQIGWEQAQSPGMPFNQLLTLPCELSLKHTSKGLRLTRKPIDDLISLREGLNQNSNLDTFKAELMEIRLDIDATQLGKIEFTARGAKIEYDCSKQELIVNDLHAEAPKINGRQNIIIYVDKTMLEVFASDGLIYMPIPYIPSKDNLSIKLTDENHILKLSDIKVYRLKSIWE